MIKKHIIGVLIMISTAFPLASCSGETERNITAPESSPPVSATTQVDLSVTPSTGLTAELSALWKKIDGSTATIPLTAALHGHLGSGGSPPMHNTTSEAYNRLFAKTSDLIFVTYPSDNEFETAKQNGVELEIIPIVKDALVFLVNIENPVNGLALSQLRDIYTGKITNWISVGGTDRVIIPYQRSADSGSQTLLIKLVMDGQKPMDAPAEWLAAEMGWLVEAVSGYDNARDAVGYSMFYYVNNMYGNSRFKLLTVDGVKPNRDSIARGDYPLETFYYAVIRKESPADSPERKLINWLLTDEGQALAAGAGYIPLRPLEDELSNDTTDPVYAGDTEFSTGTGGTDVKGPAAAGELVSHGVRKPLSDVFFDGFNYIQYINSEIVRQMQTATVSEFNTSAPAAEAVSIRPFTGIPNDYPNYEILGYGYLNVNFPEGNPFFAGSKSFNIRLTADISPYGTGLGGFTATYHYAKRLTANIDLFTLQVTITGAEDATERVNGRLQSWIDGFPDSDDKKELLESFAGWYGSSSEHPYRLQPICGRWKNYLSVSYPLQTYDGPSNHLPTVYTICFDMATGDEVKLVDVIPRGLPYADAQIFTPIRYFKGKLDEGYPPQEFFENYTPADGTIYNEAWLWGGMLGMYATEPGGRELQVFFYDNWS